METGRLPRTRPESRPARGHPSLRAIRGGPRAGRAALDVPLGLEVAELLGRLGPLVSVRVASGARKGTSGWQNVCDGRLHT
jgi:hypothetical protein